MEDGGVSLSFTSDCLLLAGEFGIVANWIGCPQLGTSGTSNSCAGKLDIAQSSSISSVLALSTPIASTTGSRSGSLGSTSDANSPTASSNPKSPDVGKREQPQSWLLGGAALLAEAGLSFL